MKKILFVCLGNICRSPSAEAVMNYLIEENDLTEIIECDSAGTYGYHAGEMADRRMQKHAIKRGYDLTSISRAVIESDFDDFDYIVAMDNSNYSNLIAMAQNNIEENKIFKMTDFCQNMNVDEVPDPYYGGEQGFENVLDILEDATQGFLNKIIKDMN